MTTVLSAPSAPTDRPYALRLLTPLPATGADQPPAPPESRYDAERQIVVGGLAMAYYSTMARRGTPVPEKIDRMTGGADSWW
ncbi:hypothetical protein AB0B15_03185 [Streptomyces sp. NPDC045456]|uniref:hypothetical protein n=1 Tax=Streptomyces sp. NPDC045456 TaxID=3155254 RepID=UPI0033CB5B48